MVDHLPLADGAITGFVPTQHYSSYYLYVEHEGGKNLTLIDVTRANRPALLADVTDAPSAGTGTNLFAVAGTAALLTDVPIVATGAAPTARTVRIMDFSDARHPRVSREFTGVTAMSRDERRGMIFLANGDGVWILRQSLATDPEVEKEYDHHVIYDH